MSRSCPTFRIRGRCICLCHRSGLKTTRRERRVERHWLLFESPQPNRTKLRHLGSRIYGGLLRGKKQARPPGPGTPPHQRLGLSGDFSTFYRPPENKNEG